MRCSRCPADAWIGAPACSLRLSPVSVLAAPLVADHRFRLTLRLHVLESNERLHPFLMRPLYVSRGVRFGFALTNTAAIGRKEYAVLDHVEQVLAPNLLAFELGAIEISLGQVPHRLLSTLVGD